MARDLTAFNRRCKAAFPDFVEARFNDAAGRYEIVTLSVAGKHVSQFFGVFRNPLNGAPIEPDVHTGLLPFREFDESAQEEVFQSMQKTGLDNRFDGAGSHKNAQANARKKNSELIAQRRLKRAETLLHLFDEVNLKRPWVKHHPHAKDPALGGSVLKLPVDAFDKGLQHLPLTEENAQIVIDFLFRTKRWQEDPEHLLRNFHKWRRDFIAAGRELERAGTQQPSDAELDWPQRVRTEHRKNPRHWTIGRLAVLVGKTREEVEAALQQ